MRKTILNFLLVFITLVSCQNNQNIPTDAPTTATLATQTPRSIEDILSHLSIDETNTLQTLTMVDDYPLYTMVSSVDYGDIADLNALPPLTLENRNENTPSWACTLFAALADEENMLYGRNFDWDYSPTLFLYTNPDDGYASVSMVDLAYLFSSLEDARQLDQLPLEDRIPLLAAPWMPFDGMNEKGLVVGMAAVPSGNISPDPDKVTVDSLVIIRLILDNAQNVAEAVEIFNQYNIDWGSGPDLHYLIADRSGQAVLIEFYKGKMRIIPNQEPWHIATNFLCSAAGNNPEGQCWRYDRVNENLTSQNGDISPEQAITLLEHVSQSNTQWSVVYQMSTGLVDIAMGRDYSNSITLEMAMDND